MMPAPLTRDQLHEIAVRRRGDADVLALLLEIKRLHGVPVRAHDLAAANPTYPDDLNASYTQQRLGELLREEPAIEAPQERSYGKPKRPEPERRYPHISDERQTKRRARDERG